MFSVKPTFSIIGMGYIFPRHVSAIKKFGQIVAVCDIDINKKRICPKGAEFFQWYWELPKTDYVVICTPNHLHFEMIKFFHGKSKIIVEKPPVLNMQQFKALENINPYVVLQLRYHPLIQSISFPEKKRNQVFLNVVVKRDKEYWRTWKGEEHLSGGINYNIGIHYLDLMIHLFGEPKNVVHNSRTDSYSVGFYDTENTHVNFKFLIQQSKWGITRSFMVNGKDFELCNKNNLSEENLHKKVYENILKGNGITLKDCRPVFELLEKLKEI